LKKKYKDINDENNRAGNKKNLWKYLEQFGEVYGSKTSTKVVVSFDTGRPREKLRIDTELDQKKEKGTPDEDKQSTSSDANAQPQSLSLTKGTQLKGKTHTMSDSTKSRNKIGSL
jgi:hypothetical protein